MESVQLLPETPAALIHEEQRAGSADDNQILAAVIVDISEERASGVVQEAEARIFREVLKGAVAAIAIEAIGQTGGLADVQIVKTVAVDVANGNAVVAVNIDAASAVERGTPVVAAIPQLLRERGSAGERLRRNVGKHGD